MLVGRGSCAYRELREAVAVQFATSGHVVEIAKGAEGALAIRYGPMGEIASTEIVEGDASRGAFYAELGEVLAMLEPATGQVQ